MILSEGSAIKMKKLLAFTLILVLASALALTACGRNNDDEPQEQTQVQATPTPTPTPTPPPQDPADDEDDDIEEDTNGDEDVNEEDDVVEDDDNIEEDENDTEEDVIEEDEEEEYVPADEPEEAPPERVVVNIPRPANTVYSLATDSYIQSFDVGTTSVDADILGGSRYLTQAGNPTFSIVANPLSGVANALHVSGRGGNWYAVDLVTASLGLNTGANDYAVTIRGSLEAGAPTTMVIFGGSESPWNWLGNVEVTGGGNFTLTTTISAAAIAATDGGAAQFANGFRIQTNNNVAFTITEIDIVRGAAAPVATPPPAVTASPFTGNTVYSLVLDPDIISAGVGTSGDGTAVLGARTFLSEAGNPTLTIVAGHGIQVSNRDADWHTIDIIRENMSMNTAANTYTIRVRGSVATVTEGLQVIIGGPDNPWNWLGNVEPNANGSFEVIANTADMAATDGGAAQFNRGFRIQTNNTVAFTIYEIVITRN